MTEDFEFDLGPLTWVKGEVDNALNAAKQALSEWNGEDTNPLKAAAAHLHQVSGALAIVDLQGVSLLCAETEGLLQGMADSEERRDMDHARVGVRAIEALLAYLDELMGGAPNAELKLTGIYAEVLGKRGAEPPAPSELFFPDLSPRIARPQGEAPPLDDVALASTLRRSRSEYQRGLLLFLQDKDPVAGLMYMDHAVHAVERLAPGAAQHTFWWAVTGLIEAMRRGALPVDFWVKRLCGRIDLQMRRLMEGHRQLAERLLRDALYYLAMDPSPSGRSLDVRRAFQLDRYLPPEAGVIEAQANWRPHLNALRESLNIAKDHWMKHCARHPESLAPFQAAALTMFEAAVRLPNEPLKSLTRMVHAEAKRLPSVAEPTQNEALQLEMATALLLTQNAIEHFESLGDEFERQCDVLTQRLQAAVDPSYDTSRIPTDVSMLDEYSRKAQEKLILAQVSHEIQANLNEVEDILDKFFRDATERSRLPLVPGLIKQVLGALNIMQLTVAADLTKQILSRIERFADPEYPISPEELNWVADALSTLGLYMEALRYGQDDVEKLSSLLVRSDQLPSPEASVEAQIKEDISQLKARVAEAEAAGDTTQLREEVRTAAGKLKRDADLVGDTGLHAQTQAILGLFEQSAPDQDILAAVASLGPTAPSAAAPTPEAAELVTASDEAIDAEMLQVYIEEAQDVLGSIATQVARLHITLYDNDAFVSIRRSFHTLKGSGRMVGLTDLAEVAWQVEQTLNQWLRDEKAPTPELVAFLERTGDGFSDWVQTLQESGRVQIDADDIVAGAHSFRGDEEAPNHPKPEAGLPASSSGAGKEEPMMEIGAHRLPAALYQIFLDEASQRLTDLHAHLPQLVAGHRPEDWESFSRAAHTLAGIARTTGFQPLADAAHAVEAWAGSWPDKIQPLVREADTALQEALQGLTDMLVSIESGRWPEDRPDILPRLEGTRPSVGPEAAGGLPPTPVTAEVPPESAASTEIGPESTTEPPARTDGSHSAPLSAEMNEEDEITMDNSESTPTQGGAPEVALESGSTPTAGTAPEVPPPQDQLDEQLLPIFMEEAAELLPRIGENLRQWRGAPGDMAIRHDLQRALHTLKGSARMAGAMRLGEMAHAMESRIIGHAEDSPSQSLLDALESDYDRAAEVVEHLKGGPEPVPAPGFATGQTGESMPQAATEAEASARLPPAIPPPPAFDEGEMHIRQTLRVKSNILDTLLNEAGEVAIARARIETVINAYKQTALELTTNVQRLRSQLRELEIQAESQMHSHLSQMEESQFDPLEFDRYTRLQELTRLMAESVNDVATAQDNLLAGIDDVDQALLTQSRMTRSLQQELMRLRMVQFNTLAERMYRVVRQTSKEVGRKTQLEIEGGQTELDRSVLDRIAAPLEHLLRNAIAHGIEPADVRQATGKGEYGELHLTARQEGNEIRITVSDDGAGVDLDKVRARAVELGLLSQDEPATAEQLEAMLFQPGFTTARTVTEVAGRGIGLDVVKSELAAIGGRVRLETEPGKGTRFLIRLPLTLALTPVVLARAGGQVFALPANVVTMVREVTLEELQDLHEAGGVEHGGEHYPLRALSDLTDRQPEPGESPLRTILLVKSGGERLALWVDALEGNYEAVVKNTGAQLARISGVVGATVLGDGRIALILNPFVLAEHSPRTLQTIEEVGLQQAQAPLVLVVDDSLTVRKITSRLLNREGYRVATAKDGVEAMERMQEELPAVVLLDIEMPRMDGFEVTRAVRADDRLKNVPIIMVTSRTAEKHREHALDLGVDAYMGKPYQEEELLEGIARLAGQAVTG